MKSEKLKSMLKGIWAFCSYVFVPQWGKNKNGATSNDVAPFKAQSN